MMKSLFVIAMFIGSTVAGAESESLPPDKRLDVIERWVVTDADWPSAPDHVERSPRKQESACEKLARQKHHAQAAEGYRLLALHFSESDEAELALIRAGEEYLALGDVNNARWMLAEQRPRYARTRWLDEIYAAEVALADALLKESVAGMTLSNRIAEARKLYSRVKSEDPYGASAESVAKGLANCEALHAKALILDEEEPPECEPLLQFPDPDPANNVLQDFNGRRLTRGEAAYFSRIQELSRQSKQPDGEHPEKIYEALCDLFREHGNLDLARALMEKASSVNPESVAMLDKLGVLELECGLTNAAEDHLTKAMKLAPASREIGFHCAQALDANRHGAEASRLFIDMLEDGLAPAGATLSAARCFLGGHAIDSAESLCRSVVRNDKAADRGAAAYDLALILCARGHWEEALTALKSVDVSWRSRADVARLSARALAALGKKDEAIAKLTTLRADRPLLLDAEFQLAALQGRPIKEILDSRPDLPRRVDSLEIHGLKRVSEEAVHQLMGTRFGRIYHQSVWDADFKRLQASGLFKHVQTTEPKYGPGGDVSLTLEVEETGAPDEKKKPRDEF